MNSTTFYSHGKLLLTGEYLVLDGAKALGLPTKKGQKLKVETTQFSQQIHWESKLEDNSTWLSMDFQWSQNLKFSSEETSPEAQKLIEIFNYIASQKPELFQQKEHGFSFCSKLEFDKNWGLGSSSTLINNFAQWARIDAFQLQFKIFGGSGYDIACAQNSTPIIYHKEENQIQVEPIQFLPKFKNQLFFVYLNQKKNSRQAIQHYKTLNPITKLDAKERIDEISRQILHVDSLADFESLLTAHEKIMATLLEEFPIKRHLFQDYPRAIKSLGAWGGDFILATGGEAEKEYFRKRNYTTILDYDKMILNV